MVELKVVISTPSTSIAPSVAIIFGFLFWVRAANAVRLSCPFGGGSLAFHSALALRPVRIAPLRGHLFVPPFVCRLHPPRQDFDLDFAASRHRAGESLFHQKSCFNSGFGN